MKTRLLLKKIHLYLALIATVPILILCITGSILTYKEAIDEYFTRPYMVVEPKETKLSIKEMVVRLEEELPEQKFLGVIFPPKEGLSYFFWMKDSTYWTVAYIDPYTGTFKGVRDWYDWSMANIIWWVTDLHYSFKWGRTGSYFVAASSFILLLSVMSGIYLWWPKRSKFTRSKFRLRRAKRWKQTAYNLHGVIGFYISFILVLVTITGIGITFSEDINKFMHAVRGEKIAEPPKKAPDEGRAYLETEEIVAIAKRHLKDNYGITPDVQSMAFPTPENVIVELGFQGPPEFASAAHSHVFVDAQSGEVKMVETASNQTGAEKFVSWIAPIHYGTWGLIFGKGGDFYTRLVWIFVALTPIFLIVTGFTIANSRRSSRRTRI